MSRIHWVTPFLLSYIHRYISFAEVGRICRAVLREPMHLCTCVSEKGGDGEDVCSETPSLMSYILRYVILAELGNDCQVELRDLFYYESRKRELKTRLIYEDRCDERLKN